MSCGSDTEQTGYRVCLDVSRPPPVFYLRDGLGVRGPEIAGWGTISRASATLDGGAFASGRHRLLRLVVVGSFV